jgi:hypothetical protein
MGRCDRLERSGEYLGITLSLTIRHSRGLYIRPPTQHVKLHEGLDGNPDVAGAALTFTAKADVDPKTIITDQSISMQYKDRAFRFKVKFKFQSFHRPRMRCTDL